MRNLPIIKIDLISIRIEIIARVRIIIIIVGVVMHINITKNETKIN